MIVLESDDTPVDKDVLLHLDISNVLLLVQPNEVWGPLIIPSDLFSSTALSIVTNKSSHDNIASSDTSVEVPLPINQTTIEQEIENIQFVYLYVQ